MIPIYKPYLPAGSLKYAYDALNSTWLSSNGKYLSMTEGKLQELLGVKYLQLLNNGTSACHLVAKCLSKLREKAYVIVPDNVYVAAWNAFLFDGSFDLITVKTDLLTWNYDMTELDRAIADRPDAAVLIVHNIGNIINVPDLQRKYPTTLFVEDNCEGFLGTYEGVYSGTVSYTSAISFYGNKLVTSGEGGCFITNDEEAYLFAKCVQGQGQSAKRFVHNELGYNYRMTNIQAAILYGQLEILPQIMEMKEEIFYDYRLALENRDDILYQTIAPNTKHSNWMFGVRIPKQTNYEIAEKYFTEKNIEIRPMFYPITEHQHLTNNYCVNIGNCENAKLLNKQCLILPSYPALTVDEQAFILDTLNSYVKTLSNK